MTAWPPGRLEALRSSATECSAACMGGPSARLTLPAAAAAH